MNAYELAKYMDDNIDAYYATEQKYLDKAANMLRQQADRIAELEKDLEGCEYFLDKQESAEPVAWINQNIEVENGKPQLAWHKDNFAEICKPLYTTPHHASDAKQIKELSDEEIYKLAGEFWIEGSFDDGELDYVGFARAILKKASEK